MIRRTSIPWRELPHLRVRECAELAGISVREMESRLGERPLEVRTIGRLRFVTTDSFRAWLGEDVGPAARGRLVVSSDTREEARRLLRGIG